jgi:Fe-Mn family superoxide dismutase
MAFTLPDLPYDFASLEPHIDARTMQIHHDKHHGGYVTKLNAALEQAPEFQGKPIEDLLGSLDELPEGVRTAVRNNGGGHYNHSLFWKIMAPSGGGRPESELLGALNKSFGSFDNFRKVFASAAAGVFGSGWAWLALDSRGNLRVTSTPNQDSPVMQGMHPILGLDVWEHAYYLKYQNLRPDYIAAFWNVVNWPQVGENLQKVEAQAVEVARR